MADTSISRKDFLHERRLIQRNDEIQSAQTRQRLEESQLLKTIREICAAINTEAGTVIVEEHHYLPPEPVVSSFAFARGHTEYVMRLELWGENPRWCLPPPVNGVTLHRTGFFAGSASSQDRSRLP